MSYMQIEADLIAAQAECEATLEKIKRCIHMLKGHSRPIEAAFIEPPKPRKAAKKMTLHAAMQKVLRESPTKKLRASEIIGELERLNLYRMKDGRLPESQQIHARANHYPDLFGKDGSFFYAK